MGMPGFDHVLAAVADAWQNRREETIEQAGRLTEHVRTLSSVSLEHGRAVARRCCSSAGGGVGAELRSSPRRLRRRAEVSAPDGPAAAAARSGVASRSDGMLHMVTHTLDKMAAGGIYDHLGGGFHRYSVDERWLVPHFEKMLYDNALLASLLPRGLPGHASGELSAASRARRSTTCCAK